MGDSRVHATVLIVCNGLQYTATLKNGTTVSGTSMIQGSSGSTFRRPRTDFNLIRLCGVVPDQKGVSVVVFA